MNASQTALRRATRAGCSIPRCASAPPRQWARLASDSARQPAPGRRGGKAVGFAAVFAVAAAGAYYYSEFRGQAESEPEKGGPAKAEFEFEKPRKRPVSKEDNRELISSQHLQVKSSWEHPGVYAWGSNAGKVIDPDSDDKYVKFPRRIAHFNDQLLRGLKLTQYFGAAIAENGDLVQWGTGFSKTDPRPQTTLKGKDLVRLEVSEDRVIALSRGGVVYSIPSSRDDQVNGVKRERETSAWSLWSSGGKEAVSFRTLTPTSLRRGERVTDISSGLEHCLMLTNKGRVFSAASSTTSFPSKGQMGIPTLEWDRRPEGPYDQAHEIMDLRGFEVTQIATGDFHSVVLDKAGRLFSFGENIFGQLGSEVELAMPSMFAPTSVAVDRLYRGSGLTAKVTSIAAGGANTFFTVQAAAAAAPAAEARGAAPARRMPRTVSDLWACGRGVYGTLGTGQWSHVTARPAKVKALSSLLEFDEKAQRMAAIGLKSMSVGATHCAAVMDNVTETGTTARSGENATNWGADVLFWGGNEHYQLGTGRRSNANTPTYIGAPGGAEAGRGREAEAVHRLCLTPRQTARIGEGGKGRRVTLEQKVECGRFVTGMYSAV